MRLWGVKRSIQTWSLLLEQFSERVCRLIRHLIVGHAAGEPGHAHRADHAVRATYAMASAASVVILRLSIVGCARMADGPPVSARSAGAQHDGPQPGQKLVERGRLVYNAT